MHGVYLPMFCLSLMFYYSSRSGSYSTQLSAYLLILHFVKDYRYSQFGKSSKSQCRRRCCIALAPPKGKSRFRGGPNAKDVTG